MESDRYDPVMRYPPTKLLNMISGSASFRLLEFILDPKPIPLSMQDAVLVSVDLESRVDTSLGKSQGQRQITQLGTASLDTRRLAEIDLNEPRSLLDAVQSQVFNIYPKRASKKAWIPKSLWAMPEQIEHDDVCAKLNEILFNQRTALTTSDASTTNKETRDVILIGHSISSDRKLLRDLFGFDIKRVTSIKAVLDTGRMMCSGYDFGIASHSHFPLRWALRYLGIPYDQLHDAGNDAMFTMKALLLMFCNWKRQKGRHLWNIAEDTMLGTTSTNKTTEQLLWDCRLEILSAIAREPWPMSKKPVPAHRATTLIQHVKAETDILSTEALCLTDLFD